MNIIKFNHHYEKFRGQEYQPARLIEIDYFDAENLPELLVKYDTVYWEDGIEKFYPLPKEGPLIYLLFIGGDFVPFCTLRKYTAEKWAYYQEKKGEFFRIEIVK